MSPASGPHPQLYDEAFLDLAFTIIIWFIEFRRTSSDFFADAGYHIVPRQTSTVWTYM